MLEFVGNGVIGISKEWEFRDYVKTIREVGVNAVILSSDFGQQGNPLHPDGLLQYFDGLRKEGLTVQQVEQMAKTNPAKLLGVR